MHAADSVELNHELKGVFKIVQFILLKKIIKNRWPL